jgi:hypothetical protein
MLRRDKAIEKCKRCGYLDHLNDKKLCIGCQQTVSSTNYHLKKYHEEHQIQDVIIDALQEIIRQERQC